MKISDYKTKKNNFFPLVIFLFFISFVSFFYLISIESGLDLSRKAGLKIESTLGEMRIKVDENDLGATPFSESNFSSGKHQVALSKIDPFYTVWEKEVNLVSGLETYINRELGPSSNFSSGEIIYFDNKAGGLSIISSPTEAIVLIGDEKKGETPLFMPEMEVGNYEITISKEGYNQRKVNIRVQEGYMTNIAIDLFEIPITANAEILRTSQVSGFPSVEMISREAWGAYDGLGNYTEDEYFPSTKMVWYDLSSENSLLFSDVRTWIKGIYYYEIVYNNLSDLSWHFFIDSEGKIYEGKKGGFEVALSGEEKGLIKVGYLGNKKEGVTSEAQGAYSLLENSISEGGNYKAEIAEGVGDEVLELEAGEQKILGVTYKNSGLGTWYNTEPRKAYLASEGESSIFYTGENWVSSQIVEILPVSFVPQTEEVRFEFILMVPNGAGEHAEKFALYVERNGQKQKIEGSEFTVKVEVTGGVEPMVLIKNTETGYLNVRDQAGTGGGIIDRVSPGDKYVYIEEQSGWVKIKLPAGGEGWVAAVYVEKIN